MENEKWEEKFYDEYGEFGYMNFAIHSPKPIIDFIHSLLKAEREKAIDECIEEVDSLIPSYDRTDISFLDDEGKGELKAYTDIIDVLSGLK